VLGFTLACKGGRLRIGLGEGAWRRLEQALARAHEAPDPAKAAREAVGGWLEAQGPAYAACAQEATLGRVLDRAASCGFREVGVLANLRDRWRAAWQRWRALRRAAACPSPPR
jgi:hypothetical protein